MKRILLALLLLLSSQLYAQFKTDVLVIGGSAGGTAAAVQAARSGVKAILVETGSFLIGNAIPDMNVPAFDTGIWKEWKDSCKKDIDSLRQTDSRITLEKKIVNKTKSLQYLKNVQILNIKPKGKGWEATINRNGKKEKIKAKILVDAEFEQEKDIISRFKLTSLTDSKINGIITYTPQQQQNPYEQIQKIYRTSGATGFGKDSSTVHYLPLGAFISKEKTNLLVANNRAAFTGFNEDAFKNIALWANAGQMVGALAAYGPFFNTTPDKTNIRLTQGEVINFKNIVYPVLDVDKSNYSWIPVQKIIASQILKHNFTNGRFNPDSLVHKEDIKQILSELHPRSRIWFLENAETSLLTVKETISLLSFIGGKEQFIITDELKNAWKNKYKFGSAYSEDKFISREEFAVLVDAYLNPFSVRVNMSGHFIR